MAKNLAAQRGRKAAKRKQVLAERRKSGTGHPPVSEQIARAAASPVMLCMMPDEDQIAAGMGTVVVARGYGAWTTTVFFLVDTAALGVKDAFVRSFEGDDLDDAIAGMTATSPMVEAEPARVRKFLHELVAWAREIGFAPPPEYEALEKIFGDVDIATCDAIFTFGREGRPVYVPGPTDTAALMLQRSEILAEYDQRMGLPPLPPADY